MLQKVGVSVPSAADCKNEIVAVGVGEFQVFIVTGVHCSLETQLQSSVLISHRRVLHILCGVSHRLRVPPAREPKYYITPSSWTMLSVCYSRSGNRLQRVVI